LQGVEGDVVRGALDGQAAGADGGGGGSGLCGLEADPSVLGGDDGLAVEDGPGREVMAGESEVAPCGGDIASGAGPQADSVAGPPHDHSVAVHLRLCAIELSTRCRPAPCRSQAGGSLHPPGARVAA
jgi:hypothetical protein